MAAATKKTANAAKPPLPLLARLRAGILAEDWASVRAAYAVLTGELLGVETAAPAKPKRPKRAAPPPDTESEEPAVTPAFEAAAEAEASGGVLLSIPKGPKREAREVPNPSGFVNRFVPPKPSPRELEIDRKLLKGVGVSERDRPPDRTIDVRVTCDICKKPYTAKSWEVNRRVGDEDMLNRCPRC